MAEDDVFFGVGGERNFPPVLERVTLVIQFGEEFDDLRAVFAARFDQYCRAETLQQRAQLVHDDQLIPFDVALDEIEPLQPGEKLAAAPHLGGELHVGLGARLHHEILSRAEVAARADGGVAHADLALGGAERESALFSRYCTLAAIGTIADVMRMEGENRTIVQCGLEGIDRSDFTGLHALLREAGLTGRPVSSVQIGFVLAPRINAAGRMGRAELAAELLLTQDPAKAERLARELCDLNRERQSVEQDIFRCAIEQMDTLAPTERNALVLSSEEWHQGVVGIVASRLSEKFSCPSFMIHLAGGMGKGSCRSYGGFNLFAALEACSDLLVGFGGHELAAGFTIKEENIPAFRKRINQYVRTHCGDSAPVSSLEIDAALTRPSLITLQEVEELSRLEPYGAGNNRPVFCLCGARLESMQSVGQNKHLKLRLQKGHTSFDGIFFSVTPAECGLTVGERVDAAFYLQVNEFRGSRSLQLQLVDLRSAHDPGAREAEQLELCRTLIRGGGVSAKDAAKLLPSREQFVRVWRALEREVGGTLTSPELPFLRRLSAEALGAESFPRTVMCLAVFAERGLVTVERHDKYITLRLTGGKRVDLDASPYLCALREGLDGTKGGSSV